MSTTVRSKLLNRNIRQYPHRSFVGHRVAVTGGLGSIGSALIRSGMPPQGGFWSALDLVHSVYGQYDALDANILNYESLVRSLHDQKIDMIVHAAAHKHAPAAEDIPAPVADLNVRGTENVVNAALELGIDRLVFASTCKAAQPETVYGASKLIGERIVLNAGFTVARFYNVVETAGNVFRIWEQATADGNQCAVMPARRRFIHIGEAVSFVLSCFDRDPGRYVPHSSPIDVRDIHSAWLREHAARNTGMYLAPLRRGDREIEPEWGAHEWAIPQSDGAFRVVSPHD